MPRDIKQARNDRAFAWIVLKENSIHHNLFGKDSLEGSYTQLSAEPRLH